MGETIQSMVVDMCSAPYADGRREITVMLHEIYADESRWNRNGITWLEEYVKENAETIRGMPFCVRYWDEEHGIPYDHGFEGRVEDGMPIYEESTVVGVAEDYEIRDITIDGISHRVLCAKGVLYQQRCPNFVSWLEKQLRDGIRVYSSIEIVAPRGSKQIEYRDGWKEEGRIPTRYVYSGHSFLTVLPADDQSVVLELNQKTKTEVEKMDETKVMEIAEEVEKRVKVLIEKNEDYMDMLEDKDEEIAKLKERIAQLEEELRGKEETMSSYEQDACKKDAEIEELKKKVCDYERCDAIRELNEALSSFTEEQKAAAKDEIAAFSEDPVGSGHSVSAIRQKIEACAYQAIVAARQVENNSVSTGVVTETIVAQEKNDYDFDHVFMA